MVQETKIMIVEGGSMTPGSFRAILKNSGYNECGSYCELRGHKYDPIKDLNC